jgi:hypothetical protein
MAQLVLECPHCRAEKIGFASRGFAGVKPGHPHTLMFMQCEGCGQALVLTMAGPPAQVQHWINGQAANPGQIVGSYPQPAALKSPPDVPPAVQAAFLSGLDNLGRKGGTNAAAIMFRRSLEIATKIVNPKAAAGDNLKKRIDDLPADIATPAMKEWAHHVRLDANDATHEPEEFSESDAKELHVFVEMFLTYAFTLPEMLKRAKTPSPGVGAKGG